jgi:hypothetical protein
MAEPKQLDSTTSDYEQGLEKKEPDATTAAVDLNVGDPKVESQSYGKPESSQGSIKVHTPGRLARFLPKRLLSVPPIPEGRPLPAKGRVGILSRITFGWVAHLTYTANRRPIEMQDIPTIEAEANAKASARRLKESIDSYHLAGSRWPIQRAVFTCYRRRFLVSATFMATSILVSSSHVTFIYQALGLYLNRAYNHGDNANFGVGVGWILLVLVAALVARALMVYQEYMTATIAMEVRTALGNIMFSKAFTISPSAVAKIGGNFKEKDLQPATFSPGTILSRMANDGDRVFYLLQRIHHLWSIFLITLIVTGYAYYLIAWPGLLTPAIGILSFAIVVPLGLLTSKVRSELNDVTDARVSLVSDIINGMSLLKQVIPVSSRELPSHVYNEFLLTLMQILCMGKHLYEHFGQIADQRGKMSFLHLRLVDSQIHHQFLNDSSRCCSVFLALHNICRRYLCVLEPLSIYIAPRRTLSLLHLVCRST